MSFFVLGSGLTRFFGFVLGVFDHGYAAALMFAIAFTLAILLAAGVVDAADLTSMQRQCAAEIEQANGCTTACVNALWKEVARCTNEKIGHRFPPDKLEKCMHQVDSRRVAARTAELVGNPVAEAFTCAEG